MRWDGSNALAWTASDGQLHGPFQGIDAILGYMRFVMPVRGGSPSHGNVPKHKGAQRQSRGERLVCPALRTAEQRAYGDAARRQKDVRWLQAVLVESGMGGYT